MTNLSHKLKEELKDTQKILIAGIGSEVRSDDSLGLLITEKLKQTFLPSSKVEILFCGPSPENFTGIIRKSSPSHIILIDAADMGKPPGYIDIVDPLVLQNITTSTHTFPLAMLTEYLKFSIPCKVIVIGVQPKNTLLGYKLSHEVKESINKLINILKEAISLKVLTAEKS